MDDKVAHASGAIGIVVKSAPPVVVSGLTLFGVTLQEWVYVVTLIWVLWQLGWSIWDRFFKPPSGKRGKR